MRYLLFIVLMTLSIACHAQTSIEHSSLLINQEYTITSNHTDTHYFSIPDEHQGWRVVLHSPQRKLKVQIYKKLVGGGAQQVYSETASSHTQFFTPSDIDNSEGFYIAVRNESYDGDYRLVSEPTFARQLSWTNGGRHTDISQWQTPQSDTGFIGGDHLFYYDYQGEATTDLIRMLVKVADGAPDVIVGYSIGELSDDFQFFYQENHAVGYFSRDEVAVGSRIYIKVRPRYVNNSSANLDWQLALGDPNVIDLGALSSEFANNGQVDDIIEPYLFFQTQISDETPAWQLYLSEANGASSQHNVYVSNDKLATKDHHQQAFFQNQLLVPDYLTSGRYFIGVEVDDASSINLKSRIQPFSPLSFNDSTSIATSSNSEFPFITYQVNVPVNQIGWQITLDAEHTNSSLYVRKNNVANRLNNDGLSEQSGSITESITHAPPMLATGDWYITVYSPAGNRATLNSGSPDVTDINFVNTNPGVDNGTAYTQQTGWRFYRVQDINQQLGSLGWTLFLQQQPAGSRLAIRRNAVPTYWEYRRDDSTTKHSQRLDDNYTRSGVLQVAEHVADVWYIGVYSEAELGNFVLSTDSNSPPNLDFNDGEITETEKDNRYWYFYRLAVPENFEAVQLDLNNQGEEPLHMVVSKGELPADIATSQVYCSSRMPLYACNRWNSGESLAATSAYAPFAAMPELQGNQRLILPKNAPLTAGNYFIGVKSSAYTPTHPLNYTLSATGIGTQCGDDDCQLQVINGEFGQSTTLDLANIGDVSYIRVPIPETADGWALTSRYNSGEGDIAASFAHLPNSFANASSAGLTLVRGWSVNSSDNDYLYAFRDRDQQTPTGALWLAVGAQQDNTQVALTVADLTFNGSLDEVVRQGQTVQYTQQSLESRQVKLYRFSVDGQQPAITATVDGANTDDVQLALLADTDGKVAHPATYIENIYSGEYGATVGVNEITLADAEGNYTLAVSSKGAVSDFDLTISAELLPTADPLVFNGGSKTVTDQPADSWRYYQVKVPTDADGWFVDLDQNTDSQVNLVVRKGELPEELNDSNSSACYRQPLRQCSSWQDGEQLAARKNIAGRYRLANGQINYHSTLMVGKGAPLTSGIYYVGIKTGNNSASYRLRSRGVGTLCDGSACQIPLQTIDFPSAVTGSISTPQDVSVYKFSIPNGLNSVEMQLETTLGDSSMVASRNGIASTTSYEALTQNVGFSQDTPGDEFIYHLHSNVYNSDLGHHEIILPAGDYYVTVIGQGQNAPNTQSLGAGASEFRLTVNPLEPTVLNAQALAVNETLTVEDINLQPGQLKLYRWQASTELPNIEVDFFDTVGTPHMSWNSTLDDRIELPYSPIISIAETATGGVSGSARANFPHTETDVDNFYSMLVSARANDPLATSFRIHSRGDQELDFNRGRITIEQQPINSWRYFRVEVPADAQGWEVVLEPHANTDINAVVRRGSRPDRVQGSGCSGTVMNCPEWQVDSSYILPSNGLSGYSYDYVNGSNVRDYSKRMIVGAAEPLQPGTYFIGVQSDDHDNVSYDLISRGIGTQCNGETCQHRVTAIDFGQSASGSIAENREADFFSFTVPEDAAGWQVQLNTLVGDAVLAVKQGALPNSEANRGPSTSTIGTIRDTQGTEYFYQLADANTGVALQPGTYYAAVVSQGQRDPTQRGLGRGRIDYEIAVNPITITDYTDTPIAVENSISTGSTEVDYVQLKAYRFALAESVASVEMRLRERSGDPRMAAVIEDDTGGHWPYVHFSSAAQNSAEGGRSYPFYDNEVINADRPKRQLLVVVHGDKANGEVVSQFDLTVAATPVRDLAFNGGAVQQQSLQHKQQHLYKVSVPEAINGHPIDGWTLNLDTAIGAVDMTVSKDQLPGPLNASQRIESSGQQTHLVAPFLTPGDWYIAVTSDGISEYSLNSKPLLAQAVIDFAERGEETHFETAEIDLDQQHTHYYRINVPDNNAGLIRMQLTKVSGEADTYLRYAGPPTLAHDEDRANGELFDRRNRESGSQYSNWAVADGKNGFHNGKLQLAPGEWWLAVKAADSTLRYRLQLSTGAITTLAYSGDSVTQQNLAGDDMRFYKVDIPSASEAPLPKSWSINLTESSGDVIAVFRERIPPGETAKSYRFDGGSGSVPNWYFDNNDRNTLTRDLEAGEMTIPLHHVKPGTSFYIGVYAKQDSQFALSISPGADTLQLAEKLSIIDSTADLTVAPNSRAVVQINVPNDTEWYRQRVQASAPLTMRLQRGKLGSGERPAEVETGSLLSVERKMLNRDQELQPYPWHPTANFYLTLDNTSDEAIDVSITNTGNRWEPDTQAPVFPELPLLTREATGPLTDYSLSPPYADDDYDGRVRATTTASGPWTLGQHTIVWRVTDNSGNTSTAEQTLAILDTRAPSLTVPASINVEATAALTPIELGQATANDIVDGQLIPTADQTGPFAVGSHPVTWSVTDSSGNQRSRVQYVTVSDTTAPTLSVPETITLAAKTEQGILVSESTDLQQWLDSATASDLVDAAVTVSHDARNYLAVGEHTITFRVTDAAGNSDSATSTVIVSLDDAPPQLTLPEPLVIPVDNSEGLPRSDARIQSFLNAARAVDERDGQVTVSNNLSAQVPYGLTIVTFSAEDSLGNRSEAQVELRLQLPPSKKKSGLLMLLLSTMANEDDEQEN